MNKRICDITREISNLLILASKVASESLALKLEELESEKNLLKEQLEQVCVQIDKNRVPDDKFTEAFKEASRQLLEGKLPTTKKIIELMVDKVLVYEDCIKVLFKYHPELDLKV